MAWRWARALVGLTLGVALAACGGQAPAPTETAGPPASTATLPAVTQPTATLPVAAYPATVEAPAPYPAGTETQAEGAVVPAPAETVIAPSGESLARCAYVAQGAAGAEGADWSCGAMEDGESIVLLGDITQGEDGWEITRGAAPAGAAAPVAGSEVALVLGMVLGDGTACFSAGTGATAGFQDQRLNFTCGERAADGTFTALFGELTRGDDGFHILRATGKITPDGFQADASDTPTVAALYVEP